MSRRRMTTGYSVSTLVKRIEELAVEAGRMGEDKRMPPEQSIRVRVALLVAWREARAKA